MPKRCNRCGTTNLTFVRTEGAEDVFACRRGAECGRETRFENSGGVTDAGAHSPKQADAVPATPPDQPIPAESLAEQLFGEELHLFKCRHCRGYTVTIQLHPGNVPYMLDCRAQGFFGCKGVADRILGDWPKDAPNEPRWEWVNLRVGERLTSDENAAVATAIKHAPLTLQARSA